MPNNSSESLLETQLAKSKETLIAELEKLRNDQTNWNQLLGDGGSFQGFGNMGRFGLGNMGSLGSGGTGGYASFVSSSITVKIFGGRNGVGLHADSQGLGEYKTELSEEFYSMKKSICEITMGEQTQRLTDFIRATEEAIRLKADEE